MKDVAINERLRDILDRSGTSRKEIARRLGYKTASGLQHYTDKFKKKYLPLEFIERLEKVICPPIRREELYALAGWPAEPGRTYDDFVQGLEPATRELLLRALERAQESDEPRPIKSKPHDGHGKRRH